MVMKNLKRILRMGVQFISKNRTVILVGLGISGLWGAIGETAKVAPIAKEKLEHRKEELGVEKLSVGEAIKTACPVYAPVLGMAIVSTGCIVGGTANSLRQNAALAAAYTMSENALTDYKRAAIETVGEKKERLINENIAKKKVEELPKAKNGPTVPGDVRCIDTFSGMEFYSNYGKIRSAISDINYDIATSDTYASLNDVYRALDMRTTEGGDILGWNVTDDKLEVQIDTELTSDNEPCLAITIKPYPHEDFWHLG